ncbi:MAG: hypothetical protein A2X18_07205 [Bacteroidetes bacterium GWF2_40_14]|nr:MAG: hypothetical protein A2X18_07205 [Bacteroidetes bacterium GWF2_40_14]
MDLSNIYSLRKNFTIVALTGRTGSGCTEFAESLSKGFVDNIDIYPKPVSFGYDHNVYRKYRIIYNYAYKNFQPFEIINYRDILYAFILKSGYRRFISFLDSISLKEEFKKSNFKVKTNFRNEIEKLSKLEERFDILTAEAEDVITDKTKSNDDLEKLYIFIKSPNFKKTCIELSDILQSESIIKRNKTLQIISNNLRKSGDPYNETAIDSNSIFIIAEVINDLIKSIRKRNVEKDTKIVIDTLRNPLEIMFFRQRFSAFYTFAIHRTDDSREREINLRFKGKEKKDIAILLDEEHSGAKSAEFYKQNVSQCIQNADIHIAFITKADAKDMNTKRIQKKEIVTPYYSWGMQLLKYVTLIDHPGIITPSAEERCMQLAYTAKYNSGCISRQVGAAITDEFYSMKAIGWNHTPEGQVPCSLRNAEDLIYMKNDKAAFTPFERKEKKFREALNYNYQNCINQSRELLKGRNVSYCFKSLINSYSDGKNQVHTRSLHAEESAFLQISKFGGIGIKNGKLFTTASPCELCSKKAYQLGIKVIYYIDPYPGISKSHILEAGRKERNPKIRLFEGAIGNAYHWLYEPIMTYKDELSLIFDFEIKDLTKQYQEKNNILNIENQMLESKVKKLELKIKKFESTNKKDPMKFKNKI